MDSKDGPLPGLLMVLTVVTGLVDAVSFLRLGHVFVANMTGNIVFLGFAAAGQADTDATASLVSVFSFLLGALAGGRLGVAYASHRGRMLTASIAIKTMLVGAATIVALQPAALSGTARLALVVLLALSMGIQNAIARKIGVPDVTTTVLTMTVTGLAADSRFAKGNDPRLGRRLTAIGTMFAGAALGGLLISYGGVASSLALATALLALAGIFAARASHVDSAWAKPAR